MQRGVGAETVFGGQEGKDPHIFRATVNGGGLFSIIGELNEGTHF